jgi:putative inorganic carbon (HCO3(-)) transporter
MSAMGENRQAAKLIQLAAVSMTAAVPLICVPGLASPFSVPKIALLSVWVVVGTVLLILRGLAEARFETTVQKLVLAWLALVSASALWGETVSLRALLIGLLPPASFLLLTWLKPSPVLLASALVASGSVIGCIALAQYLGLDPFRLIGWQAAPAGAARLRIYASLGNPNFVAAALACILPLTWMFEGSRLRNRLLPVSAAALMLAGIIATGSRAPILGAVALVLCAVWIFPSVSPRKRVLGLVSIVLLVVLIAGLSTGRPVREALQGRFFIWRVAVSQASARSLILGDGPGAFAIRYPEWETQWAASMPRNQENMRFLGYQEHAHNDGLEVLLEQGIPGFVLVLLIPFGVWRLFRVGGLEFDRCAAGAVSGMAVFGGLACVDFPFHRPAESFIFWTLLAIVHLVFSTVEVTYAESALCLSRADDSRGNRTGVVRKL